MTIRSLYVNKPCPPRHIPNPDSAGTARRPMPMIAGGRPDTLFRRAGRMVFPVIRQRTPPQPPRSHTEPPVPRGLPVVSQTLCETGFRQLNKRKSRRGRTRDHDNRTNGTPRVVRRRSHAVLSRKTRTERTASCPAERPAQRQPRKSRYDLINYNNCNHIKYQCKRIL